MSCDDTGNTYNTVLTVHIVSAGVVHSGCLKAGELLLGTRDVVHLDTADTITIKASSHHDPVLKFDGTSTAGNEDGKGRVKKKIWKFEISILLLTPLPLKYGK